MTDVAEAPSAPAAPSFGDSTSTSLVVRWLEPANTGPAITDYDVQYREGTTGNFTDHPHTGTARTATLTGLTPGASYEVQVRARNAEGTSDWSDSGTATTGDNAAPVFAQASYAFDLAENDDGSTTAVDVGTVSASDADGHTVAYSIAAGNTGDRFAIDGSTGALTYGGTGENHEATPTIALTVQASDGHNGSATVTVTVTVTDVDTEAPGKPAAPEVSATAGSLTSIDVSWTAPMNAGPAITDYDVEYRLASATTWTDHPHTGAGTTATIASLAEATEYVVRVRANGTRRARAPGRTRAPARPESTTRRAGRRRRPSATRPRAASWSTGWSRPIRARPSPTTTCATAR